MKIKTPTRLQWCAENVVQTGPDDYDFEVTQTYNEVTIGESPTVGLVGADGVILELCNTPDNIATLREISTALNAHDKLVEALDAYEEVMGSGGYRGRPMDCVETREWEWLMGRVREARAALEQQPEGG